MESLRAAFIPTGSRGSTPAAAERVQSPCSQQKIGRIRRRLEEGCLKSGVRGQSGSAIRETPTNILEISYQVG